MNVSCNTSHCVSTRPLMLPNDSVGQQRWIFGSCGLSNAECPWRTGRQNKPPPVANTRWLKPVSRCSTELQRATLCVRLLSLSADYWQGMHLVWRRGWRLHCGKKNGQQNQTKKNTLMLDGASGWMGVWRVQITCEVSRRSPPWRRLHLQQPSKNNSWVIHRRFCFRSPLYSVCENRQFYLLAVLP